MKIEDRFTVAAPIDRTWAAITDPDLVGACLPGCESVETLSDMAYKAAIKFALGPIKVRFQVDVEVTEEDPPSRAVSVTRGEEGGRAGSARAENILSLRAIGPTETEVHYGSEVSVTGRIAKFGFGIMKKKAQTLGQEFAEAFRARVEGEGGGA